MRAFSFIGLIALLATASTVRGDATTVEGQLNVFTTQSSQANTIAASISITNFFSTAPQLVQQLQNIVSLESQYINDMSATPQSALSAADQQAVAGAFQDFVQVSQQMLATIIGKHGLLSLTPFTQPIAAVLRSLEGTTDTIAFAIVDMVPTQAQGVTSNKGSLDSTLEQAVALYSDGVAGTGIGRRFL